MRLTFRQIIAGLCLSCATAPEAARAAVTNICPGHEPAGRVPSAGATAQAPLRAGPDSQVVVMEYEAWFGPRTGIAPQASVTTCLQSANMQPLGGGYDSVAPRVIATHAAWLAQAGVDAVTLDLSNNVSCIFDGDDAAIIAQACPNAVFRAQNLHIADQAYALYPAWHALGTPLKIIPLLGGFDKFALTPDPDDPRHRTALQKEAQAFGRRMRDNAALNVLYLGKPLMLVYLGTPVDPGRVAAIRAMLKSSGLDHAYTFRLIAGYLDSQPQFWARPNHVPHGPIHIDPRDDFWSVVDRLNFWGAPPAPYFPTYSTHDGRIENMTASLATAGQRGWACTGTGGYCPDAALRYCGKGYQNGCVPGDYETLHEFMGYARRLQPIFLVIDQFNEFAEPDEGQTNNSNDDAEPTLQWGYSGLLAIAAEIGRYRRQ